MRKTKYALRNSQMERNLFLDVTKGTVIFLMLWGHCIQCMIPSEMDFYENGIFKIIYSFHMPCFALISGYFLWYSFNRPNEDVRSTLGKRIIALMIPIVFAQLLNAALCQLPNMVINIGFSSFKEGILSAASFDSLWFFWSILAAVICLALAKYISDNVMVQLVCLILFIPLVWQLPCGGKNLFMYPYVIIGYYFCSIKKHISNKCMIFTGTATIPVYIALLFFFEKKHYIYTTGMYSSEYSLFQNVHIHLFRYAIGLIGSVAFISFLYMSFRLFKEKDYMQFNMLGKYSLQIYALSCALLSYYLPKITRIFYERFPDVEVFLSRHGAIYSMGVTLAASIIYSFVLYGGIRLLEKIKIAKYIYGR